jgi:hypothetical protein
MDRERAAQVATAFASFSELLTACRRGFIPTLRESECDELPIRRAKHVLRRELERQGLPVFPERH